MSRDHSTAEILNRDQICKQLDKIMAHPEFSGSEILRKFLSYIVYEKLDGNAVQIKEYTIAVHVLNKPANFETQKNGIVRIHASRLRKALSSYYQSSDGEDAVIISIPRGGYIPVFRSCEMFVILPDSANPRYWSRSVSSQLIRYY